MKIEEIAKEILKYGSFSVIMHTRPDGDTIGAGLALCSALKKAGKRANAFCANELPDKFSFLVGSDGVSTELSSEAEANICVDCADIGRIGGFAEKLGKLPVFNIDHHVSNTNYGKYNFVRDCAATCEIIFDLIVAMNIEIDENLAETLLVGICTDTGNFEHKNVTKETFFIAGKLTEKGADINKINRLMFKNQTLERAQLFAASISKIRYYHENRLAIMYVLREDLKKFNAKEEYTEGFIDFPLSINTVEVAVCLLETNNKNFKISFRSKGKVNVNEIASYYGGGGHILASGCIMNGFFEDVVDKLQYKIGQYL